MLDHQRLVDAADDWIVNRSRTVMLAFLVLTGVFLVGAGASGTETGTDQFTEDIPAQNAFENINEQFETRSFEASTGSTTLIQNEPNVLSKSSQLAMLRAQRRLHENPDFRVVSSSSVAEAVATRLDPNATTPAAKVRALETAPASRVQAATRAVLSTRPLLRQRVSEDYNAQSVTASATLGGVTHRLGPDVDEQSTRFETMQLHAQYVVASVDGDIQVFGSGIVNREFTQVIPDSLLIVIPAAALLILVFLTFAYRDPFDLALGLVALVMTIVWTFGFSGYAGIPFGQILVAVPPLLLAVGIDFGIHAINRFREERAEGYDVPRSMRNATDQLLVAFFIVTGTTVIGFLANVTSPLPPIREFGIVAGAGIVFTFLIFGIFLPAAKVWLQRVRDAYGLPEFSNASLGSEESLLGRVLPVGVSIGRVAPALFLLLVLTSTAGLGYYGTDVSTEFTEESFLPPAENPDYLMALPEPFKPGEYTVTETRNFLEAHFESGREDRTRVYLEGELRRDTALESMARAARDPPQSFVAEGRVAQRQSIVTVIQSYAAESPEFRRLVARNDRDGDGIPDDNLETVYDALLASPQGDRARTFITEDYRSAQVIYSVEADAGQTEVTRDTRQVATRYRVAATATGTVIVFKAVSDLIAETALVSMLIALAATVLFLTLVYYVVERKPLLALANVVPIVVTIALLAATMRYADIPFNALTGTILSIAIGLGIDYSAHMVHRFADEYDRQPDVDAALVVAVRGTGGALTGSMLTTVSGIGVLVFAITPVLGQFGLLIGLSIFYSYATSILVLPSALVLWHRAHAWRTT
ncbi:MAG: RND family transporter [Haloferacaceae archaeon]